MAVHHGGRGLGGGGGDVALQLGADVGELIGKIGLQALKIYFSGENLLTFSPLKKHAKNYDPEGIYAGDADYGTGKYGTDNFGDGDGYPVMKSYTIGLTLTF